MNDNYLWDRTDEPDPEVQELEELLGTLKYQPRPFENPATMKLGRQRSFIRMAIAATVALLIIGAGLWLRFANSHSQPSITANGRGPSPKLRNDRSQATPDPIAALETKPAAGPLVKRSSLPARNFAPHARNIRPALTEKELAEKEQVLIALRLASAKLNLAQRKTQTFPQVNTIRNQHKMG